VEIIPVIDVRHGHAVRAIAGDRANYAPIETPLSPSSDPAAVAAGLLALYPFKTLYIADLDAIEGRGANAGLLQQFAASFPSTQLWIDSGARSDRVVKQVISQPRTTAVIGSETGITAGELCALKTSSAGRIVLSLDFAAGGAALGDPDVHGDPACWPGSIIAMTLGRVGGAAGPDVNRLRSLREIHPGHVFAAGGIRHRADLDAVRALGASGALISTALHAQTITAADLDEISGR